MAGNDTSTAYSTITPFVGGKDRSAPGIPRWLNEVDAARLASYAFYDDLVKNDPIQYKLMLRGGEESPLYVPVAKRMVNTIKRFVGKSVGYTITGVESTAFDNVASQMSAIWAREGFVGEFNKAKEKFIKFGDGCLLITADPEKPEGRRISIKEMDPAMYFPIFDLEDVDKLIGANIVEQYAIGDKLYVKRQRYLKNNHPDHPNFGNFDAPIQYDSAILEMTDWEDPVKAKTFRVLVKPTLLNGIVALPIYHFKNNDDGAPFGHSDLVGLERLFLGVNQAATDQDVSLSMAGLGMYVADSTPVDDNNNPTSWVIGPRRVIEVPANGKFERVSGVPSVEPSLAHIKWIESEAESTLGISDVATGQMDTAVAQSGIALALRMGPLIDSANEKNDGSLIPVLTQMFFDLAAWFLEYESVNFGPAIITPSFADALPVDKEAEYTRLTDMYNNGVISVEYYREQLSELFDYEFPANMQAQIDKATANAVDPYGTDAQGNFADGQSSAFGAAGADTQAQ